MGLKRDLPFRRIALVLSGGAAYGAYEVGVLRVLQRVGLRPALLAGVSVGALNAVVWLAHDFDTSPLERLWRSLRPAEIGMRWTTLSLRAVGSLLVALAGVEIVLLLAGWPGAAWIAHLRSVHRLRGYVMESVALELAAWLVIAAIGVAMAIGSRWLEDLLGRLGATAEADRLHRWGSYLLLAGLALYVLVLALGIPWPGRFHLLVLLALGLGLLLGRAGPARDLFRKGWLRLVPETEGRGLWRGTARRRLLTHLVRQGDPRRLVDGSVRLVISACQLESGRMGYFVNWRPVEPEFRAGIEESIGDVFEVSDPGDVIEAAVASSAVPVLYEPVPLGGRDYMDGGIFANQPVHAVTAAGADAVLMVLVSPSASPRPPSRRPSLVEIASRITELANWRDLQTELGRLPPGFSRAARPASVCVVEPQQPLGCSMFDFEPTRTAELIRLGESDALRALAGSGWLEGEVPLGSPVPAATPAQEPTPGAAPREA